MFNSRGRITPAPMFGKYLPETMNLDLHWRKR